MSIAIVANGTLLKLGDNASPTVYTTIPECMKIGGPSVKFALLDVTSHDSPSAFKEYIPGLADGDNITAEINWKPSNTVHISTRTNSYARTLTPMKTVFPDATNNTVATSCYVTDIVPKADIGAVLVANLTFKVTGLPVWS